MSQLTKEQFERAIKSLATKRDLEPLATKRDLELVKVELKKHAVDLQEELARMVKDGFDDVQKRLDVKDQIQIFERKFKKLEEALHVRL
jgi:hypothetical protein